MSVAAIEISTVVTFHADAQVYALPVDRVREIQQIVAFAEVPDAGDGICGMIDVRGEIVPVVDGRTLLGLPPAAYTVDTPMIVMLGPEGPVALVVDEVDAILDLSVDLAEPAPTLHPLASKILGVHHQEGRLVSVLDVDALLADVGKNLAKMGESGD
ncbi:MAG: chemotaxis protein CheW [Coriobacteriia bacterium]|jgi:purine-binding chemotaxis protein CheW|nr:chemotaxis protein CheW [Coriobacteriia bacterium]